MAEIKRSEREREVRHLIGQVTPEDIEDARETAEMIRFARQERREAEWAESENRQAEASGENRRRAHRVRAHEIGSVRKKLDNSARGHLALAAGVVEGRENERLDDADFAKFHKAAHRFADEAELRAKLKKLERRERAAAQVVREPGPYDDATSPHSWVRDVLVHLDPQASLLDLRSSGLSDMRPEAVAERLGQHARDVRRALMKRNAFGRRVERMMREARRQDDIVEHERLFQRDVRAAREAELRASLTTGGGVTASSSGGGAAAFVPPAFLIDDIWAEYRSPYRAFADQLNTTVPLPDYGMEVYLTIVTSGTTVATQTELSGVAEGDPVTSFSASPIVSKVGQVAVDQQFIDRAGPGITGDAVLFKQLREQTDAQIDTYAIQQSLAGVSGSGNVTNSGSFAVTTTSGVGGLMKDIKSAKNSLHDLAGVRIRGTHLFAQGDFCDYLQAFADAQGRPLFSPTLDDFWLPLKAKGDANAEGWTGYQIAGLAMFADDNIPLSGSDLQLIVTRPDHILLLEGEPIPYLYPEGYAGNLTAVIGARTYVATVARFPTGVAAISGSAYAASTFA